MFQMKCQVTSSITRRVMISREVEVASYKAVCGGEKRRVNIGYFNYLDILKVENNQLLKYPTKKAENGVTHIWEIFFKFFSIHNIEPTWLNCETAGHYDDDDGAWTGCMEKVCKG